MRLFDYVWVKLKGFFLKLDEVWENSKDYFGATLKPCRFSVLMLLAALLFLWMAPQGQDVLRALGEWSWRTGNNDGELNVGFLWDVVTAILFLAALVFWATNVWYWARVMLRFDFGEANDPTRDKSSRGDPVRKKLPRFLGVSAFFTVAIAFFKACFAYKDAGSQGVVSLLIFYGVACVFLGWVFYRTTDKRSRWSQKLYDRWVDKPISQKYYMQKVISGLQMDDVDQLYAVKYRRLSDLPFITKLSLALSLTLSLCLFSLFLVWPGSASYFGAATIVLLAAAAWIPFGSVLVYFGTKYSFPILTVILILAIVFSLWNDNHAIRALPSTPDAAYANRKTVAADFAEWLDERLKRWGSATYEGRHPVFIVAAEGGGIRAAYWAATVLTELQQRNPGFADHVYALSGVSGGSLGLAVFAALLRQDLRLNADTQDRRGGDVANTPSMRKTAKRILSHDFLSPTVAYMLYPDLVQRLLPWAVPPFDRARALEGAWERAWQEVIGNNQFGEPFLALWPQPEESNHGVAKSDAGGGHRHKPVPRLFLNSTWVETGKRVIVSNLRIDDTFSDSVDFLELTKTPIRLSTAVHNSARFTYVSPAGTVRTPDKKIWGHLVDGGYFENSGATTAHEILQSIYQTQENKEKEEWDSINHIIPVVIMIINDPKVQSKDDCGLEINDSCSPYKFMNEILSPALTLLNTRGARGSYARGAIREAALREARRRGSVSTDSGISSAQGLYWKFALQKIQEKPLPLGWVLSDISQRNMDDQLSTILRQMKLDDPLRGPSTTGSAAR